MATEASAQGSQSSKIMNPELWGNLQQHMGLEKVYVRLPLTEFFRNRLVCKEWNRLAADREFLEESFKDRPPAIPEPYFLLRCYGVWGRYKLLSMARDHHLSGRLWSTTTLPSHFRAMRALQWCQGLVLYKIRKQSPSDMELRVFDLNTRVVTTVPRSPKSINAYGWHRRAVFGMIIDRSVRPYAWKLVQGSEDANTQIYDSRSNSWIVRPSWMLHNEVLKVAAGFFSQGNVRQFHQTGVAYTSDGVVYIQCLPEDILVYDMKPADAWMSIKLPLVPSKLFLAGIGAWQDRVFTLSQDCDEDEQTIRVWELVDVAKQEWTEFSCTPVEFWCWIDSDGGDDPPLQAAMQIRASFCKEYILVHSWLRNEERMSCKAQIFALFNMATKIWQKVDMPFGPIHVGIHLYSTGFEEPRCNYRGYLW